MQFSERTYKDVFGATIIQSRLQPSVLRQGFEKRLLPGIEVGLPGWNERTVKVPAQGTKAQMPSAMPLKR